MWHGVLRRLVERVRADGGLPLVLALPMAVTITTAVSGAVVVFASAMRPA
jgi:hypothetical protein